MTALGLPATKRPASITWALEHNVGVAANPLGNTIQRIIRSGAKWRATIQWPPLQEDDAGVLAAFLDRASRGDRWLYLDHPANLARGSLAIADAVADTFVTTGQADGWFTDSSSVTVSINARRLKITNSSGSPGLPGGAYKNITLTANVPHVVVVDFDPGTTQSATVQIINATSLAVEASQKLTTAGGRFYFAVTPTQAAMRIRVVANADGHLYFRNITVTRCALVNGASQSGNRLDVDGLPVSTNGVLKAGEFVCIKAGGSFEMKRLTDDLDADSSGRGSLVFEPTLRAAPADNEPVALYRPFARFLVPGHQNAVSSNPPRDKPVHGFMLDATEDVTPLTDSAIVTDTNGPLIWEFDASALSLTPTIGSGTPTLTRSGNTGTRVNASGLIEVVNANLPRFDYDPITLAIRGLLHEETRTNILLRSAEFDNASWTKTDTTITADSVTSPDGGTNADLVTEGSAGNAQVRQSYTGTADVSQAQSIFLKRGNHDWVFVQAVDNASASHGGRFWANLSNGTLGTVENVGTGTGVAVSVESYPDGWYRFKIATAANGGITSYRMSVQSAASNGTATRVNGATRYQWGAQAENNATFATSYIPTTSASVTRNEDAISVATSAITGFSGATLTLHADGYAQNAAVANFPAILGISDGTTNENIRLYRHSNQNGSYAIADGGVTQAGSTALGNWAALTRAKIALAVAANDIAVSFNGGAAVADTSATLPTVTTVDIGAAQSSNPWNSHIRKLRLYNVRVANAYLQAMTA